ncbi:MAG: sugar nucleotide-binding protein, partial [Armatimonadota bacterium]
MRVLVTGAKGMLGQDLVRELSRRQIEHLATDHEELDLLSARALEKWAGGGLGKFDWVLNCAAYTAVDKAETEQLQANRLNAAAPGALAHACKFHGARLLHVSTDFVFDGRASSPYTEAAPPHPLGVYGSSKREGEVQVMAALPDALVCRTAWLFGPLGKSFPKTMIGAW